MYGGKQVRMCYVVCASRFKKVIHHLAMYTFAEPAIICAFEHSLGEKLINSFFFKFLGLSDCQLFAVIILFQNTKSLPKKPSCDKN